MRKKPSRLSAFIVLLLLSSPLTVRAGDQRLTMLIHPFLTAPELHKKFTPLAHYLSKETGRTVEVKISKSFQKHVDSVGKDEMDFAYMGSNTYVEMTKIYDKKPLLACLEINGKPFFYGAIITKADSPIQTLSELAGKRFAFVDHESTMGHYVPSFMLQEAGISKAELAQSDFLGSHTNVALAVLNGYYVAGAVKDETFEAYQGRGLKMLAKTPPIQEHLFVASSQLPEPLIIKLREALLNLHDPQVLTAIQPTITGMSPVKDTDYDSLRQITEAVNRSDQ